MYTVDILVNAMRELVAQLVAYVPQIIMALIIWWVGNYFLTMGANLLRKIDIPKTKLDEKIADLLIRVVMPVGKVLLVLIILDYLGIGRTVISAVATGLTLTLAIALGIAFGKALEPEAETVVKEFKKYLDKVKTK